MLWCTSGDIVTEIWITFSIPLYPKNFFSEVFVIPRYPRFSAINHVFNILIFILNLAKFWKD